MGDLTSQPGFSELKAVRNGKVFLIDGNRYMNRPGPMILESFYILAGLFHPDLYKSLIPDGAVAGLGT